MQASLEGYSETQPIQTSQLSHDGHVNTSDPGHVLIQRKGDGILNIYIFSVNLWAHAP